MRGVHRPKLPPGRPPSTEPRPLRGGGSLVPCPVSKSPFHRTRSVSERSPRLFHCSLRSNLQNPPPGYIRKQRAASDSAPESRRKVLRPPPHRLFRSGQS